MNANHRAQASHGSPNQFDPLDSSPRPIPDGSRYVLREPLARENGSERVATTNAAKPSLQRTHSQPLVQQVSSSGQDRLMPPGAMVGSSQSGRPPLVRSASTSIVEDEPAIQGIEEAGSIGSVTTAKRRRDSIVSANGLDTREIKRVSNDLRPTCVVCLVLVLTLPGDPGPLRFDRPPTCMASRERRRR